MERVDVVVVGAGVTGLAAARALATAHRCSVCVIERHRRPGIDTSTHNSGVIHAGIYAPVGSLKSRLAVKGRRRLYEFCAAYDVPHRRCGKVIVAASQDEIAALERLFALGRANGVDDLVLVDAAFVARREPHINAVAAIYSPSSGIVDAERLVSALLGSCEAAGVIFFPAARLVGAEEGADGIVLHTERESILAGQVVNAAGLFADQVSSLVGGETFTIFPCRGEYAELVPARRSLVNGLVYPLPDPSGHSLGLHLLPTTHGEVWLGPTIRYQDRRDDYEGDRLPLEAFVEPARRLLRGIGPGDLGLGGSGIRPKLQSPTGSFVDFLIRRDSLNPRVVHAAGIDSPGLTSCLAVGRFVSEIVADGLR